MSKSMGLFLAFGSSPTPWVGDVADDGLTALIDRNVLGNGQGIIYLDAKVAGGAFDLGMPEQEYRRSQWADRDSRLYLGM